MRLSWACPRAGVCLGLLLLSASGCTGQVTGVPLRITHGAEEDPFADATDLDLRFSRAGVLEHEERFPVDTTSLDIGVLAFGADLRVELSVLAGEYELSRGASFPFAVQASAPPPRVDVFVGRVGRFTDAGIEPLDSAVVGLGANGAGALVATSRGTLYRYDAHAPLDGRPQLTRLATYPELSGASWLALDDGGLLAVGGDGGRARRFDDMGEPQTEVFDPRLDDQRRGAVLVPVAGAAIVLGGSPLFFGGMSARVSRVLLHPDGSLEVAPLPDLPCATRDVSASLVTIPSVSGAPSDRIVLVCGDALRESRLVAVDPDGAAMATELTLPGDLRRASLAALGVGLLLVAGGRSPEGVATEVVHVLALGDGSTSEIVNASRGLFTARVGAAASVLSPGRVLLVGGRDAGGQPLASAEILTFPGRVVQTGNAPLPMASPRLVSLGDGALLAVDASGVAQYIPTR